MTDREIVSAQLTALRAGPAQRWRVFRRLEVICKLCGGLLLEVMATSPPAMAFRTVESVGNAEPRSGGRVKLRASDHRFWLFSDAPDIFLVTCKCQTPGLLLSDIDRWLMTGTTRILLGANGVPQPDRSRQES